MQQGAWNRGWGVGGWKHTDGTCHPPMQPCPKARPTGAANCRQQYNQGSCHPARPPPPLVCMLLGAWPDHTDDPLHRRMWVRLQRHPFGPGGNAAHRVERSTTAGSAHAMYRTNSNPPLFVWHVTGAREHLFMPLL